MFQRPDLKFYMLYVICSSSNCDTHCTVKYLYVYNYIYMLHVAKCCLILCKKTLISILCLNIWTMMKHWPHIVPLGQLPFPARVQMLLHSQWWTAGERMEGRMILSQWPPGPESGQMWWCCQQHFVRKSELQ